MIITSTLPASARSYSRPTVAASSQSAGNPTDSAEITPQRGSIASGIALAVIGSGLIAAASIGIPSIFGLPALAAVPTGTLLNGALRFCGLMAYCGAHDQLAQGDDNRVARGALLCAAGAAGMAGAAGAFGPIGGLTAVCMGIGGFFTTLNGIGKLAGEKSEA